MTVRWKPLIVLSALFLVIGVGGLLVVTLDLVPPDSAEILATARSEWKAGRHGNAQIHFLRALQVEPRNAAVHRELATMYQEWAAIETDPTRQTQLRAEHLSALTDAARHGNDPEPRRLLLDDALEHDDLVQAVVWAKKLLDLDASDADAHYVMALDALEGASPDPARLARELAALESREPNRLRTAWIRVSLARLQADAAATEAALAPCRDLGMPDSAELDDRMAFVRLRQADVLATSDPAALAARVRALEIAAATVGKAPKLPPQRLVIIGQLLEQAQRHIGRLVSAAPAPAQSELNTASQALEAVATASFQTAVDADKGTNLRHLLDYAEHLHYRQDRDACLALVEKALALPAAGLPAWSETVAQLHQVAIKASLMGDDPAERLTGAEPHIQFLLKAGSPTHQAVGHLFQGVIELERSGAAASGPQSASVDSKLRASALEHLKVAAAGLPETATAQALYGVALLLSDETALGRQYLAAAQRLPEIEPRYQLWSAWAMIRAGYPEEAQPVVDRLREEAGRGNVGPELMPSLELLTGEIEQARQTPEGLKNARAAFQRAIAISSPDDRVALELRLAQIDVLLGEHQAALDRVAPLREHGNGGPAAEHLVLLILTDRGELDAARTHLDAARARYPASAELAEADAALWLRQQQPARAEAALAAFLKDQPHSLGATQLRARVLAENLERIDEARALLTDAAAWSDSTAPLLQLALMDLGRGNTEAVARTVAEIRSRWPDAALADLLDAQLSLARGNTGEASDNLRKALEKDPANKVALFWKAQLDARDGNADQATAAYEAIARSNSVKELDEGLSLTTAANWALAALALENRQVDSAISRLQGMLSGGQLSDSLSRPVRWQLASARAAKGQWAQARTEVAALLKDPGITVEERIRAANLYRLNGEPKQAVALLDAVLAGDPGNTGAVAMRAFLQAEADPAGAAALLRKALDSSTQPPSLYLMSAAVENMVPPENTGLDRALATIDAGLVRHPDSLELVQGRFRVLRLAGRADEGRAYVESHTATDPEGRYRRLLVDILRDEDKPEQAEPIVAALIAENPDDPELALNQVQLRAQRAIQAAQQGDPAAEKSLSDEASGLARQLRARFPKDLRFAQAEAELAARAGQMDRAMALSRELDSLDPRSPEGPTLRARLSAARGWTEGVAREYAEAVNRAPRRADLRLALGQATLALGKTDESIRQANWLMEATPEDPSGLVLKVRSLLRANGAADELQANRREAVQLLQQTLAAQPDFLPAYHLLAEVQAASGDRPGATATLQKALQIDPRDSAGLSQLVGLLAEPSASGQAADPAALAQADALAKAHAAADPTGNQALAVAIAFNKAGQVERALPWAQTATTQLDSWVAHLNYGDLLLAQAEATADSTAARAIFDQALAEYDRVLQARPDCVEAVNNKAWILHEYLDRHADALALAEALRQRVDPATLPPDFYDTLGSIQEAMNQRKQAESSYSQGLKQATEHPILNLHMARLLAGERGRGAIARAHLDRALAGRDMLPPAMAAELDTLDRQLAE